MWKSMPENLDEEQPLSSVPLPNVRQILLFAEKGVFCSVEDIRLVGPGRERCCDPVRPVGGETERGGCAPGLSMVILRIVRPWFADPESKSARRFSVYVEK